MSNKTRRITGQKLKRRGGKKQPRLSESLFRNWVARETRPPRSATRRPELPPAALRKGRAHWLKLSLSFRPASRRTAQAGRLCYQQAIFQTRSEWLVRPFQTEDHC